MLMSFLHWTTTRSMCAIVCLLCCSLWSQDKPANTEGLHVLILGGTTFLGPHVTNELLSRGHKVTHFNRGNKHCFSFPEVETIQGDRDGNLDALKGRVWDAVIDTSGYFPRVVEASSKILAGVTKHYTFISTISVYADLHQLNIDENAPLAKLGTNSDEKNADNYGSFKAACEKIVQAYFPDNSLIIRPGLIVGPNDSTDRFTYWVRRIAEGGNVLIPNCPKQNVQVIDVRDLAKWIVTMVERQESGTYNATGPKEELSFESFVHECGRFAVKNVDYVWVDEKFLIDAHLDNWNKLPMWLSSTSSMAGLFSIDSQKAQKMGLDYRPLSETICATLNWDSKRKNRVMKVGLSRDEEENLLRATSRSLRVHVPPTHRDLHSLQSRRD